jgi:hypothetical protein
MSALEQSATNPYKAPQMEQTVLPEHPLREGAFVLDEEIAPALLEVPTIVSHETYMHKRGAITREGIVFTDGTLYPVTSGIPTHLRSDTAVVFKTAWLTTSSGGHNMRIFLKMLDLGYPVIMVGPVGEIPNPELSRKERFVHAKKVSMPQIAHHIDCIAALKLAGHGLRENEIINIGESQGAGVGFGVRNKKYGDYVGAPYNREIASHEVFSAVKQLLLEPASLGKIAIQKILGRDRALFHYLHTFHTRPEQYAIELFKIPMFFSGQAGRLLASMDQNIPVHYRALNQDGWGQPAEYERAILSRPNARFERVDGTHLDLAKSETLGNLAIRLNTLADLRGVDGAFEDVDFESVLYATERPRPRKLRNSVSLRPAA